MRLRNRRPVRPEQCIQGIALFAKIAPGRGACLGLRGGTSAALFRGGSGVDRSAFRLGGGPPTSPIKILNLPYFLNAFNQLASASRG